MLSSLHLAGVASIDSVGQCSYARAPDQMFPGSTDAFAFTHPASDPRGAVDADGNRSSVTPDRWERVKALFAAALELPPIDRSVLLDRECGPEDDDVRRELETLLAAHGKASGFLEPEAGLLGLSAARSVLEPGQRIGRYVLFGLLGVGGMGEVYLAEDVRLGRKIALKLLPRSVSADPVRLKRFEQEARAASALSHPNVCVIHEVGEANTSMGQADGNQARYYIAMEHVAGISLRELLARHQAENSRLPLAQVLDVVLQTATGLAAAHNAGVVHRDVKPENIMIRPDGIVKVLDFGLAKLAAREAHDVMHDGPDARRSDVHTEPGVVLGTVQYMSPEQARGLPVDARTDVWSLGVVLYEMVSGRPPFAGNTASDVMVAVLEREPRPLESFAPEAPHAISDVVSRALSKDRAARLATMNELSQSLATVRRELKDTPAHNLTPSEQPDAIRLRSAVEPNRVPSGRVPGTRTRVFVGIVAVAVFVSAVGWWRSRGAGETVAGSAADRVATARVKLAVLPFENLGRPDDAYLADGIADEIRGKLAALPGLQVIARSSSIAYRSTTKPARDIARELGVQYLLTATIRWEPKIGGSLGRVRVSPELVHVTDAQPVTEWQAPFDATLEDVFQVQTEVATRVAQALDVRLGSSERERLATQPTSSLAAYYAFLQGEAEADQLMRDDDAAQERAMRMYERAVALDSGFAMSWARLGSVRSVLVHSARISGRSFPPGVSPGSAKSAAERAVALAPLRPEGYLALGEYFRSVERSVPKTAEQIANGLRVAPNDPNLLTASGVLRYEAGEPDSALAPLQRAFALDPRSIFASSWLGEVLLKMKRYPEAAEVLARARTLAPLNLTILQQSAIVELARGDLVAARAIIRQAPKELAYARIAEYFVANKDLGWALDDEGQRILLRLRPAAFGGDRRDWGLALAQVHAVRGDTALMRAYADSARIAIEKGSMSSSTSPESHVLYGVALAYLGRYAEAEREGRSAIELIGKGTGSRKADAYIRHQLLRIELLAGQHEKTLDLLEPLLKEGYYPSPGWLRVDPLFTPLRHHPRFARLAGES